MFGITFDLAAYYGAAFFACCRILGSHSAGYPAKSLTPTRYHRRLPPRQHNSRHVISLINSPSKFRRFYCHGNRTAVAPVVTLSFRFPINAGTPIAGRIVDTPTTTTPLDYMHRLEKQHWIGNLKSTRH
jgi:hypothetical protein